MGTNPENEAQPKVNECIALITPVDFTARLRPPRISFTGIEDIAVESLAQRLQFCDRPRSRETDRPPARAYFQSKAGWRGRFPLGEFRVLGRLTGA